MEAESAGLGSSPTQHTTKEHLIAVVSHNMVGEATLQVSKDVISSPEHTPDSAYLPLHFMASTAQDKIICDSWKIKVQRAFEVWLY